VPPTARVELVGPGVNITVNTTGIAECCNNPSTFGSFSRFSVSISSFGGVTQQQFIDLLVAGEIRLIVRVAEGILYGPNPYYIAGKPYTLRAVLTGAQVIPPVQTAATGQLDIAIKSDFNSPTAPFLLTHSVANPTSLTLNLVTFPLNSNLLRGALGLFDIAQLSQIAFTSPPGTPIPNYFVTVKSQQYPSGEIRGQLTVSPRESFCGNLSGLNEIPPINSIGGGGVLLEVVNALQQLYFTITTDAINIIGVQIRGPASPTQTAPVLATICSQFCNQFTFYGAIGMGSPVLAPGVTLDSLLSILREGLAYVDIQTTQSPTGFLRANLGAKNLTTPQSPFDHQAPNPGVPTPSVSLPPSPSAGTPFSVPFLFAKRRR